MEKTIHYQIFTGPLEVDWLIAEILYGNEHIGDLVEWGEKFLIYPKDDGQPWEFPANDFVKVIQEARERVRFIPPQDRAAVSEERINTSIILDR